MAEDQPPAAAETRKPRAYQKKLTDADRDALRAILRRPEARVNGRIHVATVCRLTGLSQAVVYSFMRREPYFHAEVAESNPGTVAPTEDELINPKHSPPPGIMMSPDDFAKAQAILRQQRKMMAKDWAALGMDEKMAARMEKLSTVGGAPLLPVIQMLYGGLIKHVATLDEVLEGDAERIKNDLLPREVDGDGHPVEDGKIQREWRYCWYAGYKLHLDLFNSMQKTQAMLARLMREMKELGMNAKSPEKGVYEAVVSERTSDAS